MPSIVLKHTYLRVNDTQKLRQMPKTIEAQRKDILNFYWRAFPRDTDGLIVHQWHTRRNVARLLVKTHHR